MARYTAPDPGAYNRRITIQQEPTVTVGVWGEAKPAWATVIQTWAAFIAKTYRAEKLDAQPMVRRQAHYRIRRIPSVPIQVGMRVVDTTTADVSQTYSILDVQDIGGARRELLLICQMVLPDGGA